MSAAKTQPLRQMPRQRIVSLARSLSDDLRVLWRGLGLTVSVSPTLTVCYLVLLVTMNLAPVLQTWLTKLLVDQITVGVGGSPEAIRAALWLAAIYVLALVIPAGLGPAQQALMAWLEDRTVAEVDRRLMHTATRLVDLFRIERPEFQDELRTLQQASFGPSRLAAFLQQGVGNVLTIGGLLLLLIHLHPVLPIVVVALTVPHLVAQRRFNVLKYQVMAQQSRSAREMDYCARIATEPAAAKEVRVFGLGDFFRRRFRDRFERALFETGRLRVRELCSSVVFGGLHAIALAGGFWYVASRAGASEAAQRLTLGDVALYLQAVIQAESRLWLIANWFGYLYETLLILRGFFAFLDDARPSISLAQPGRGLLAPTALSSGIELRDVRFRYLKSDQDVLAGVSAVLPAGKVTALVGANGAGKSTLVKLLTRMYDPDDGQIVLDGVPLANYDLESWRRCVAVVHQDFARFALTLRENVGVGAVASGRGADHVDEAIRRAGGDDLVAKLPQGYETQLTRRFQGGVDLSGGEWQKVALARTFIRDAAFVILDEPASALDAEAEFRLFQRFREVVAGKTALVISHRFSTVRMADQILVLEDGRIVEDGSHADLVAAGGRYARLFEMQAGRYR